MILPRQALENNVSISDGNLLFSTINSAYAVVLNYGPSVFTPGLWDFEMREPERFKEVTPQIHGI
jgi:hypothetical protein